MRGTSPPGPSSNRSDLARSEPSGTAQSRRADSPAQVFDAWKTLLEQVNLSDREAVLAFLKNLAGGHAEWSSAGQAVFNDLIAHEAYAVFVDAFTMNSRIGKSYAESDGKPFKATLVLQLPAQWKPTAPALLHDALRRAQVQRVELLCQPLDDTYIETFDASDAPIPAAVCEAAATLLKYGASELAVRGVLAKPDVVLEAMGVSDQFDSLELGQNRYTSPSAAEKQCYEKLLLGVKGTQLKHLTILQAALIPSQQDGELAELPRWPTLTSLNVGGITMPSIAPLQWLLGIAAQSSALRELSLTFTETQTHAHVKPTLDRLKHHKGLRKLELNGGAMSPNSASCLQVLLWVVQVAYASRTLTHFKWDAKVTHWPDAVAAMKRNFSQIDVREALLKESPDMEAALQDPNFPLQCLILIGIFLPSGFLESFFRGMAGNTSFRHVDLSTCVADIRSTKRWRHSMNINRTLNFMGLPLDPSGYYMHMRVARPADAIRAFVQGPNSYNRLNAAGEMQHRDDFQPESSGAHAPENPDQPEPFDGDLKEHADTLQADSYERQRTIRPAALRALTLDVAHLMTTGAAVARAAISDVHAAALVDVAKIVTRHLENDGALRSIVHLSEVAPSMDRHRNSPADAPQRDDHDVQPFVRAHNRIAVAHRLTHAPLAVNKVDATGANERLMKAVRANDPRLLRQLLAQGAIDFGRRAERVAPTGMLRRSFLAVNRVDANGANLKMMAAVEANDAEQVLRLRALGAIDYNGQAKAAAQKKSLAVRAAFDKDALPTTSTLNAGKLTKSELSGKPHA